MTSVSLFVGAGCVRINSDEAFSGLFVLLFDGQRVGHLLCPSSRPPTVGQHDLWIHLTSDASARNLHRLRPCRYLRYVLALCLQLLLTICLPSGPFEPSLHKINSPQLGVLHSGETETSSSKRQGTASRWSTSTTSAITGCPRCPSCPEPQFSKLSTM